MTLENKVLEKKRASNYIRFGEEGYFIYNDENRRKIERIGSGINTLPDCRIFENGKYIGETEFHKALDFLFEN